MTCRLKMNNTSFQIDSLMIAQDTIYNFEVKNMGSEYFYEDNTFYSVTGTEIKNPIYQTQRSKALLRQLLKILIETFILKHWLSL